MGDRAPFESEFVSAYQEAVQDLDLECIQSVGNCTQAVFTTGIIAEFEGEESDLTTDVLADIELAFLETVESEYENNEETCNENFVTVESVGSAVIADDARRLEAAFLPRIKYVEYNGRRMQDETTLAPSEQPSSQPTDYPTIEGFGVNEAPSISPTTSPTIAVFSNTQSIQVLLYVAGTCR